jgi:hypothetical protein
VKVREGNIMKAFGRASQCTQHRDQGSLATDLDQIDIHQRSPGRRQIRIHHRGHGI